MQNSLFLISNLHEADFRIRTLLFIGIVPAGFISSKLDGLRPEKSTFQMPTGFAARPLVQRSFPLRSS
jgi:hypothetical protein